MVQVALCFFFLACGWLPNIWEPTIIEPDIQPAATIVNFTVQNSPDDAFQKDSDSTWDTSSVFVKCVTNTNPSLRFHAGFLFDGVTVPQGATINEANLSLNIYSTTYDNAKFDLYGNDVDDAATFGSGTDIMSRTRTTQTVLCNQNNVPLGWYVIDVTDVVEEITNRTGWSSGNNMSFLCIAQSSAYKELRCFSYDYGSSVPKLDVDYTISSSPEFEDVAKSTSLVAALCDFSANCTDPDGLSHWKWRQNWTGSWEEEIYAFTGSPTQAWTNITKRLPTGDVLPYEVQWEIKANDTLGNWGTTGVQTFNLTALDYSSEFSVEADSYVSGDWSTVGTAPYINGTDYPISYIQAAAVKTCSFSWSHTNVTTILGEEIRLRVNYSSTGRVTTVYYKFGSEWPSATEWRQASTTLGGTGGSWSVADVTLKGENDYNWNQENWWSFYYVNQLEVNFTTDATAGTVNIDFAKVYFDAYENSTRQVEWIFDNIVNRMENSSFPLTYKYNENQTTLSDVADNKLLYGVYMYELYNNQTFMDYANLYGNWLLGQPKCRVFQNYNFTSKEWNTVLGSGESCYRMFALAELTNQNSSYITLLKNVVENFTDIFYHPQTGDPSKNHIVSQADVNGTVTDNIVDCPESWSALAYTAYVLGNSTIADRAVNASMSYQLTGIGAPASYQTLDGTYPGGDVKSDQHWGYTLLGLSSVYYYTVDSAVKNKLKTCAECGQYFFNSSLADYGYFVYRINKTDGTETSNQAVHGFGYAEEGCIQAGLIWSNQTWIDWALNDFKSMVINKHILKNYLILHAVNPSGSPSNWESSDGWNSMAKRCALIWYCLNKSDFCYQNSTFVQRYSQLYASTSANHAFKLNWHAQIMTHTLNLYSGNDHEASFNLLFRNVMNETETTINGLDDIYMSFGNPFSGVGGEAICTPLSVGWNHFDVWDQDVTHTLGEVNASLNVDVASWTVLVFEASGGVQYPFLYGKPASENPYTSTTVTSGGEFWVNVNIEEKWYHSYP